MRPDCPQLRFRRVASAEETQLAPVAGVAGLQLLGAFEVSTGRGDVTQGLAHGGEVEDERRGVGVPAKRRLPDCASLAQTVARDHRVAFVEGWRAGLELDRFPGDPWCDRFRRGDGRLV